MADGTGAGEHRRPTAARRADGSVRTVAGRSGHASASKPMVAGSGSVGRTDGPPSGPPPGRRVPEEVRRAATGGPHEATAHVAAGSPPTGPAGRPRCGRSGVVSVMVVVLGPAGRLGGGAADQPAAGPPGGQSGAARMSLVVSGARRRCPGRAAGRAAISVPGPGLCAAVGTGAARSHRLADQDDQRAGRAAGPSGGGGSRRPHRHHHAPTTSPSTTTSSHNDQSTVPIQLGETLTERQMLEALLTQSANDIAYSLAVWDAGTEPAFVAKMNAAGRLARCRLHPLRRRQWLRPPVRLHGRGLPAHRRGRHGHPHLRRRGGDDHGEHSPWWGRSTTS